MEPTDITMPISENGQIFVACNAPAPIAVNGGGFVGCARRQGHDRSPDEAIAKHEVTLTW